MVLAAAAVGGWFLYDWFGSPAERRFAFTDPSVTVTANCADPARPAGITALRVTAGTEFDAAKRGEPGALPALAREAALRAAAKAGCEATLPAAPPL